MDARRRERAVLGDRRGRGEIFGYDGGHRHHHGAVPGVRPPRRAARRSPEAVRQAVEDGREVDIEYRIVLPDGDERWIHSRGRMQPASATNPARLLGVSIDVTERKEVGGRAAAVVRRGHRSSAASSSSKTPTSSSEHRLQHGSGRIVGESPAIMAVLELVEQVAPTETTVLVEGETGTGKELIAQRIHELSPRANRPMVKVNCAALPSTLVESELFGREKGAYTGAVSREPGRFEVANGSTLFLDEIAELPFELQAKLLRVLEEGRFERVGSSTHVEDRCPGDRRHQPRSRGRGRGGALPPRPLLPPGRLPDPGAAAARAPR